MAGLLHVVATPIGNLDELSPRAAKCLCEVEIVFAEDTRHSRKLLARLGSNRRLQSLHEHNERKRVDEVISLLAENKSIALLTDAGTPGVSDPGATLVRAVADAGFGVVPITGPSALAAALSVCGFAESSTDAWFVGFLPAKGKARRAKLDRVAAHPGVVVLYEAPHRLHTTLKDLTPYDPQRQVCLCREMTKVHEEVCHTTVGDLEARFSERGKARGEITLVLGPVTATELSPEDELVDAALRRCLDAGLSARDASLAVAAVLELSRRHVYQRCQRIAVDQ
ncbi:16S rRNA (cytidine(1402)-2'-O)-methyltransferase [Myxococcota bacterium]